MASLNRSARWLALAATVLSLVACYGTMATIAVLALLGLRLQINETLWAGAIILLASAAVVGLAFGARQYRVLWPLALGVIGAAALAYVMTVSYDRLIEVGGFLLLGLAAIADWRKRRSPPQPTRSTSTGAARTAGNPERAE